MARERCSETCLLLPVSSWPCVGGGRERSPATEGAVVGGRGAPTLLSAHPWSWNLLWRCLCSIFWGGGKALALLSVYQQQQSPSLVKGAAMRLPPSCLPFRAGPRDAACLRSYGNQLRAAASKPLFPRLALRGWRRRRRGCAAAAAAVGQKPSQRNWPASFYARETECPSALSGRRDTHSNAQGACPPLWM